uniref:Uncharacterized protein n=1 Tax=Plectus sambesii TaxID=2011161 RepID=A0A914V8G0_9BILA
MVQLPEQMTQQTTPKLLLISSGTRTEAQRRNKRGGFVRQFSQRIVRREKRPGDPLKRSIDYRFESSNRRRSRSLEQRPQVVLDQSTSTSGKS